MSKTVCVCMYYRLHNIVIFKLLLLKIIVHGPAGLSVVPVGC